MELGAGVGDQRVDAARFCCMYRLDKHDKHSPSNAWMTRDVACMGPVDDLSLEKRRHKQPVWGATLRDRSVSRILPDLFLYSEEEPNWRDRG